MASGFRTFDHTADLGLEVWADTPQALFEHAAIAVLAQLAEAGPDDPPAESARLELQGHDTRDLLVHWLNTALLEAELKQALWTRATVERLEPTRIVAELQGPRLDPTRHTLLREIKAVSHHDLALDLTPGRCRCRLVLDL